MSLVSAAAAVAGCPGRLLSADVRPTVDRSAVGESRRAPPPVFAQRCLLAARRCNVEGQQPPRGITTDESGRVALCSVLLLQLIACVMPGSRSSTDPEHKSPRESGEDSEDESEILEESPCGRWLKRREEVCPLASPLLPHPYPLAVRPVRLGSVQSRAFDVVCVLYVYRFASGRKTAHPGIVSPSPRHLVEREHGSVGRWTLDAKRRQRS